MKQVREVKGSKPKGICKSAFCSKKCKGKFCSTCRSVLARLADPVRYSYIALRNNAKRRGKDFTITLEYFRQFCIKTNYIGMKGRGKDSYTVDRIDNNKGYVPGNIQVLPKTENIKKYFSYDYRTQYVSYTRAKQRQHADNPF